VKSERDIARFSRQCARICQELRRDGHDDAARRFEAFAIVMVAEMREPDPVRRILEGVRSMHECAACR
jgi:hypothetical protein